MMISKPKAIILYDDSISLSVNPFEASETEVSANRTRIYPYDSRRIIISLLLRVYLCLFGSVVIICMIAHVNNERIKHWLVNRMGSDPAIATWDEGEQK
jgi:hypothetical protein